MIIKVLICADSIFKRSELAKLVSENHYMVIVNIARNAIDAIKMVERYEPDILLIDLKKKNYKFLNGFRLVNAKTPISTIFFFNQEEIFSSLESKVKDFGFIDFQSIVKPKNFSRDLYKLLGNELISAIVKLIKSKFKRIEKKKVEFQESITQDDNVKKKIKIKAESQENELFRNLYQLKEKEESKDLDIDISPIKITKLETNIIVMGASVGGPKTIPFILKDIPYNFPSPILLVQHLNHFFMRQFAISLRSICQIPVKIAVNGKEIRPGIIYLSPGDHHMEIIVLNDKACFKIFEGKRVNFVRPSVDVLFISAAKVYKNNVLGILLTGMGKDGVKGLMAIKKVGGTTIAESKETSILYGMPKIAAEKEAADFVLPNYKIKDYMIKFARKL